MENLTSVTILFKSGETAQPPMSQDGIQTLKDIFMSKDRAVIDGIYGIDGASIDMIFVQP